MHILASRPQDTVVRYPKRGAIDQKEVNRMRNYELMYIIRPDVESDNVQPLTEKFQGIITNGGEIVKHDVVGKKRLAYEINKHREGTYVLVHFTAPTAVIMELERVLKITDEVIRHMIVKDVASA
jgi:small subunit ribosomal protein S6